MRSTSATSDGGNALVEFIGFAVLALAPITVFATTASLEWVTKAELQSTASLLARAYYIAGYQGFTEQKERSARKDWEVTLTHGNGIVTVHVASGKLEAVARGIE